MHQKTALCVFVSVVCFHLCVHYVLFFHVLMLGTELVICVLGTLKIVVNVNCTASVVVWSVFLKEILTETVHDNYILVCLVWLSL